MLSRSAGRSISAVLGVALLAIGCGGGGPNAPSPSAAQPTAQPTTAPTIAPRTGIASAAASPSRSPSTEPPVASMSVEGGDPVLGQLGSFTWGDGGSDSPWLPGSPIAVGAIERMTVTIADEVGVAEWTARRVPAGTSNGTGAVGLGEGGAEISFPSPPSGTWSVQVVVTFAEDLGSATYYWQVAAR